MGRWLWITLACGACSFNGTNGDPPASDGGSSDAAVSDSAPPSDVSDVCQAFSPHHATGGLPALNGPITMPANDTYLFNTDLGTFTTPAGEVGVISDVIGGVRILAASAITIGPDATLRVTGEFPLYLVATGEINVRGAIDVSSDATEFGPGGEFSVCTNGPVSGIQDGGGGSGGGAAAFGGGGGNGGFGDGNGSGNPPPGGDGGVAIASAPTRIRAGCTGAPGGDGANGGVGGAGGVGGGAIELAGCTVRIAGTINAGGAGGGGGFIDAGGLPGIGGGGGGGSGGYIGLDALMLTIEDTAIIAANGGGGGEGADFNDLGVSGTAGQLSVARAPGGSGGANQGADGGGGSSEADPNGQTPSQALNDGGGGGGGGAGFILFRGAGFDPATTSATVSPAVVPMP